LRMCWTGLFRSVWVRLEVVMVQRFAGVLSARFEWMADGVYRVHVTVRSGDTCRLYLNLLTEN